MFEFKHDQIENLKKYFYFVSLHLLTLKNNENMKNERSNPHCSQQLEQNHQLFGPEWLIATLFDTGVKL